MTKKQSGGIPDPAKIEVHPLAELFPVMEGPEFDELVEDLEMNGLRTPILLHTDGRILDGRNRLRACLLAGVQPRFETWDGMGSALELVISMNLRRRHLNESQRAMLAARLREKLAKERPHRVIPKEISTANWRSGTSAGQAGTLLNVSARSVERAAKLLKDGDPELIAQVDSGKLAVSAAAGKPDRRRPKPRRSLPVVPSPATNEAVLAMWAPPGRAEEAMKLAEQWGFNQPGPERQTSGASEAGQESGRALLIAFRRNPLEAGG